MIQLVEDVSSRYDRIILDTPAALGLPDAKAVSELCDGMVLVVRAVRVYVEIALVSKTYVTVTSTAGGPGSNCLSVRISPADFLPELSAAERAIAILLAPTAVAGVDFGRDHVPVHVNDVMLFKVNTSRIAFPAILAERFVANRWTSKFLLRSQPV